MNPLWDFKSALSQERRDKLLSVRSFDEIVDRIVAGTVDSFTAEERRRSPCQGCRRAFFTIRVSESDYDAFFNSPVGYRAQYCMSIARGEEQNRRLIEAVTPTCLQFATGTPEHGFPIQMVGEPHFDVPTPRLGFPRETDSMPTKCILITDPGWRKRWQRRKAGRGTKQRGPMQRLAFSRRSGVISK